MRKLQVTVADEDGTVFGCHKLEDYLAEARSEFPNDDEETCAEMARDVLISCVADDIKYLYQAEEDS